ncbi:RagB/SusD family nutrient uptake outer membrane protein [Parapedobacter indicus]|uniref:Starch-binding associating with outer membrane n=1 Tax=Parapedobacter indicus TaxID=1477437 RepID=A0A1I3FS71_9SPHI|nr:RagB/SusD family nutrient uptake outer membrane protein [Parapedobacter indicus]PPL03860.1 putative outer membrane starch-binding protein [Parapedobacter indicus]SFI13942.1 Starch-binding associating with outer membrane [Parapedobacter indicus]
MKGITNIPLLFLLLVLTACSKDWLKPKPLSFYAPENVYINEEGFEALVVTMSKDIKQEHYNGRSLMVNEYAMSDMAVPGALANAVVKDFPQVLTPAGDGGTHDYPGKLFTHAYNSIRSANVLISRIDEVQWDLEETRNHLLASAYFYRAYWYYRLVNSYGDVPFIGEEITGPKLDFYTHSRWAILDKIQADLEWAVQWLPVSAQPGATTKGAGNHLLAKISLANLDFDKAITAATNVIEGPYALMTARFGQDAGNSGYNVIWDLFRPANINNSANTETIFSVIDRVEDPDGAREVGSFLPQAYNPAWWHAKVRDHSGGAGMVDVGEQYETYKRGNANARLTPYYLYEIWDYQHDLRRSDANWVEWNELLYNNPSSPDFGKPVDRSNFATPADTFQHSFSFPHYKTYYPGQNTGGGNGDIYIFRLAGTYLIRAEAYFWKNELDQAAMDLNRVRERAGALPITANDVTIDFIFDERARELATEEPRHGELVRVSFIMARQNMNGYNLENFSQNNWFFDRVMAKNLFFQINFSWGQQSYRIAPHNALWPIPETVISENTLGIINQNKGYSGTERNVPPLEIIE